MTKKQVTVAMNILIISKNNFQIKELIDFYADNVVLSANSNKIAIQKLLENEVDLAIIVINSNLDLGIVKYINDNFKKIKMILSIEKEMQELFSVITNSSYITIENPLRLKELKKYN